MFLVAGLAVAGLVGIAAAFYFSIRSAKGGTKRLRPAGAGRAGSGRAGIGHAGSGRTGSSRAARASSRDDQADDDTGPDPALDFGDPPRRRMGFRKGVDVDEELWPAEAFGGVSDEQFWNDLAADKPLTTAARTAQQGSGPRKRTLNTRPTTDPQALQAKREDRVRDEGFREDRSREARSHGARSRGARSRGDGRRGAGSAAYPESRTAPNPATDRTMIQPVHAATQPVPSMTPQIPGATQPVKAAASTARQPASTARQPASTARQPASAASRPVGASPQPAETRGRHRTLSAEEDPLTSAAFSLRPSGPVDGRSALRAGGSRSGGSGPGSANTYDGTSSGSPYPQAGTSYGLPSSATQAMSTPLYGESSGYGSRGSVPAGDDPRRPNGTRSHARPAGAGQGGQGGPGGQGTRPARQARPQDGYPAGNRQGPGGYPGPGSYPIPGYPGYGGYPGSSQRVPYDPREDYRRLTQLR